jgi:hypothetical protein
MLSGYHEIAVFQEGNSFNYPVFGLVALIVFPFLRGEKEIGIL